MDNDLSGDVKDTLTREPIGAKLAVGMAWLDPLEGRILEASHEFFVQLGSCPPKWRDRSVFEVLGGHKEEWGEIKRHVLSLDPEPCCLKRRFQKDDGTSHSFQMDISVLSSKDRGTDSPRWILLLQRLDPHSKEESERLRAQIEIQNLNQRLQAAIKGAGFGLWQLEVSSQKLLWDARMYELYGHTPESFGEDVDRWKVCIHPDDRRLVEEKFELLLAGQLIDNFRFRIHRFHDGELRYIEANGFVEHDIDGNVSVFAGLNWDVTDFERGQRALRSRKKLADRKSLLKTRFLAQMSHEIRTPLAIIQGYAELLANENPPMAEVHQWNKCILNACGHLQALISDVLDISKIEAGKLVIEKQPVEFSQLVKQVMNLLEPVADKKNIRLLLDIHPGIPKVIYSDALRLRQILTNLIGNAIKFSDEGPVKVLIKKAIEKPGHPLLAIRIIDKGIGIPKTHWHSIFKPFSQVDSSITRQYGGTGLGVSLSRNFANLLGGDLVVETSELGKGTCFLLTIETCDVPKDHGSQETLTDQGVASQPRLRHPQRILVVDDAEDIRELLRKMISKEGMEVVAVESGEKALDILADHSFDVALMDLQMPLQDGIAVAKEIRARGYQIPLIALSAHALVEDRQRSLDAGFDEHLSKPFKVDLLLEKMAMVMAEKERRNVTDSFSFFHLDKDGMERAQKEAKYGQGLPTGGRDCRP